MKHVFLSIVATLAVVFSISAGDNILTKWHKFSKDKKGTFTETNGILSFKNAVKSENGVNQFIRLNQTKITPIKFGGEVKGVNVQGKPTGNFSIYMDVRFKTGKPAYGQRIDFQPGTFDWKKVEKTLKFDRPITTISFYVLFRNVTGEAQFRNVFLEEVK